MSMFIISSCNIRHRYFCSRYGRTNARLGQLLIDITATFEDEFHELEVRYKNERLLICILILYLVNRFSCINAWC